jgi:hypothetical protein
MLSSFLGLPHTFSHPFFSQALVTSTSMHASGRCLRHAAGKEIKVIYFFLSVALQKAPQIIAPDAV